MTNEEYTWDENGNVVIETLPNYVRYITELKKVPKSKISPKILEKMKETKKFKRSHFVNI